MNKVYNTIICVLVIVNLIFLYLYKRSQNDIEKLTYRCIELDNKPPEVSYKVITKEKIKYQVIPGTTQYIEKPVYVEKPVIVPADQPDMNTSQEVPDTWNTEPLGSAKNDELKPVEVTRERIIVKGKTWGYKYQDKPGQGVQKPSQGAQIEPNEASNPEIEQSVPEPEKKPKFNVLVHTGFGQDGCALTLGAGINLFGTSIGVSASSDKKIGVYGLIRFSK